MIPFPCHLKGAQERTVEDVKVLKATTNHFRVCNRWPNADAFVRALFYKSNGLEGLVFLTFEGPCRGMCRNSKKALFFWSYCALKPGEADRPLKPFQGLSRLVCSLGC